MSVTGKSFSVRNIVINEITEYYKRLSYLHSDGVIDTNSTMLCSFLNMLGLGKWIKTGSQSPCDIYCIEHKIALELKISKYDKVLFNATVYPDKLKIKDIVPTIVLENYIENGSISEDTDMEVIIVILKVSPIDNTIIDVKIMDGSYWNIDYETYTGCKELFTIVNDEFYSIMENLYSKHPDNKFIKRYLNNELPGVDIKLRKLISLNTQRQ